MYMAPFPVSVSATCRQTPVKVSAVSSGHSFPSFHTQASHQRSKAIGAEGRYATGLFPVPP